MHYRAIILCLLLPWFGGCIHTRVASLRGNEAHPEITLTAKTRGYDLGICGLVKNTEYPIVSIALNGRKEIYYDQDFTAKFPSDAYLTPDRREKVTGSIFVNWDHQKIRINFTEHDRPSRLNGTYSFKN